MGKSETFIDLADPEQSVGQTSLALVQNTLTEFKKVDAGLAALTRLYRNVVYPVSTTLGMAEAKAARLAIREPRYAVDKAAKAAKDPLNALKRDIDTRALQITTALVDLETPIHEQIKAQEDLAAAEKLAKAEAARVEAARLQIAIDGIRTMAIQAMGKTAIEIGEMYAELMGTETTLDLFGERAGEAMQAKQQTLATLESLHEAADRTESQAAQAAKDRKELEEMRAAQAERDREAEAQRAAEEQAEKARKEGEQRAAREELARERAAFAKEQADARAVQQAEAKRLADAQAELDRARAAEQQRRDDIAAAARAEDERNAKAARDEAERIAREAREAEQRRLDEEATARRAAEEAKHAADQRVRDAAPVLLEALKELTNAGAEAWGEERPCVKFARAAINTAEGEAK